VPSRADAGQEQHHGWLVREHWLTRPAYAGRSVVRLMEGDISAPMRQSDDRVDPFKRDGDPRAGLTILADIIVVVADAALQPTGLLDRRDWARGGGITVGDPPANGFGPTSTK